MSECNPSLYVKSSSIGDPGLELRSTGGPIVSSIMSGTTTIFISKYEQLLRGTANRVLIKNSQPRSGPDRDRPRPTETDRYGTESSRADMIGSTRSSCSRWTDRSGPSRSLRPIGLVHFPDLIGLTDWTDRLDRSLCSIISVLIHWLNTCCHATLCLFANT